MRILEVVDYDPGWVALFRSECENLKSIFGPNAKDIQHIGSTSVPGMKAKPTVDILIAVNCLECVNELDNDMMAAGYDPMGEYGIPGRRFFVKKRYITETDWVNAFHVHIFHESDRMNIIRHISIREFLRAHKDRAEEYGLFKVHLVEESGGEANAYVSGKEAYVKQLENDALLWFGT